MFLETYYYECQRMGLIFGQDLHNDHLHQLQKVFLSPILSQTNDLITFVSLLLEVRLKTLGGKKKIGLVIVFSSRGSA